MEFTSFSKLNISDYVYIVGIVVILLFAIAFITLAIFFFNSKKKNIIHSLEDEEIQSEVDHDVEKLIKKNKTNESIIEHYKKKQKRSKMRGKIGASVIALIYVVVVILIGFSVSVKRNNQQMWFGNTAMLVIETDSMSQAYKGNTYLQDDGKMGDENRIAQYSFITITKERKYIDNIKPFDVVAFKMLSSDNKTYITIVHRLIEVTYDSEGNPLYTFRGDANVKSMAGEYQIKKDMIVGVYETDGYKGAKNLPLGYAICYFQSNIGIIILVIAFMLMLIYSILAEKLFFIYDTRYNELLLIKLNQVEEEIKVEEAQTTIDVLPQPVEESQLDIREDATEEEIEEKIEEIAKENNIEKEKVLVKKGKVYYRDQYGRFMRLADYLKLHENDDINAPKKPKAKIIASKKAHVIKKTGKFRPRDKYGRYIRFEDYYKMLEEKKEKAEVK